MGMPVPTWARGLEWNVGQQARFISAVWSGADLGSYLTNDWCEPAGIGRALAENSEILVDGQQRLHSLEEYFLDRLEANNFNIFTQSLHVPGYSTVPFRVFRSARKQQFY